MDICEVLTNTLSGDFNVRTQAEEYLKKAQDSDYSQYLIQLGQALANASFEPHVRQAAAIALKNAIGLKPANLPDNIVFAWFVVDPNIRNQIKMMLVSLLADPKPQVSRAVSQVVLTIAEIEMPRNLWPDLIDTLTQGPHLASDEARLTSIRTIGYICQSIDPEHLRSHSNSILSALTTTADTKSVSNNELRIEAIKAIRLSLDFVASNFDTESDRNYIMNVLYDNANMGNEEVLIATYECFGEIMIKYYEYMDAYFAQALAPIAFKNLRSEDEAVVKQIHSFWDSVCDAEQMVLEERAEPDAILDSNPFFDFINQSASTLIPLLLEQMAQQDEHADIDENTISSSAAITLSNIAKTIKGNVVELVLPFVRANVSSDNWHFREAAVTAFGSILDGPEPAQLETIVDQALPLFISMLADPNPLVLDATAWALASICRLHPSTIKPKVHTLPLLRSLYDSLDKGPRVTVNACWALIYLTQKCMSVTDDDNLDKIAERNEYASHLLGLIEKLFVLSETAPDQHNVRSSIYHAIGQISQQIPDNLIGIVEKTTLEILHRLEFTLKQESQVLSNDDANTLILLQTNLLGVLTALILRLGKRVSVIRDNIIQLLLTLLQKSKNAEMFEDVMTCISVMVSTLEEEFAPYLEHLGQLILATFNTEQSPNLQFLTSNLVGDIFRHLGHLSKEFGKGVMPLFTRLLIIPSTINKVKISILTTLGEFAEVCGTEFESYLQASMGVVKDQALKINDSFVNGVPNEEELEMYEAILIVYNGIIQAYKPTPQFELLSRYFEQTFITLSLAERIPKLPSQITDLILSILGDIAEAYQKIDINQITHFYQQQWVVAIIQNARLKSNPPTTRKLAKWAKAMIPVNTDMF